MTGARLNGVEMLRCGLATHYVESRRLPELENRLSQINTSDRSVIDRVSQPCLAIGEYSSSFPAELSLPEGSVLKSLDLVENIFGRESVCEIRAALENAVDNDKPWIKSALDSLRSASPTSLELIFQQMRRAKHVENLEEALQMEYTMMSHCLRGADFYEGVRANLVDKDKNPKFSPATSEEVDKEVVGAYFIAHPDGPSRLELLTSTL
eukprot:scaffold2773_cov410-Prasinococcus_capsulatus_cf.AAC.25